MYCIHHNMYSVDHIVRLIWPYRLIAIWPRSKDTTDHENRHTIRRHLTQTVLDVNWRPTYRKMSFRLGVFGVVVVGVSFRLSSNPFPPPLARNKMPTPPPPMDPVLTSRSDDDDGREYRTPTSPPPTRNLISLEFVVSSALTSDDIRRRRRHAEEPQHERQRRTQQRQRRSRRRASLSNASRKSLTRDA